MANQETRPALFTVRDAEDALIRFTLTLFVILVGVFLHEIAIEGMTWNDAIYATLGSKSLALAWATGLTMSQEGYVIMFSRWKDYQDRRRRRFAEAKAEGKAEGKAEVYQEIAGWNQEIAAWNNRRPAAEARNEPFTEPIPSPPEPQADR